MSNSNSKKKKDIKKRDEVEELLAAAEEEMVLKMSVNSHMARGSSSQFIDPHLDRRFQALKSNKPLNNTNGNDVTNTPIKPTKPTSERANFEDGDGDLFARFAALKNSLPSHNQQKGKDHVVVDDDDDEDEVDKVIKWAMDAARLDPSPPSDSDQDEDDDDEDDDDDDDTVKKRKKGKGR